MLAKPLLKNESSETLHVPETTLRRLRTEVRDLLADNLELIQQLEEVFVGTSAPAPEVLRILFVDEGFLKLAGKSLYLIFAVSRIGKPLDVHIVPERNATALREYLEQARIILGGVDVIISDGVTAIHAAVKQIDQPVIHIQQIHRGIGKHVFIHDLMPLTDGRRVKDFTLELHADALKSGIEAIVRCEERTVAKAPRKTSSRKVKTSRKKKRTRQRATSNISVVAPPTNQSTNQRPRKRGPRSLRGP